MIWIIGSNGMLGSRLCGMLSATGMAFTGTDVETSILDPQVLSRFAHEHDSIRCMINCSAYTNVDKAESDADTAYAINERGVRNLAEIAARLDIPFIHISTDYVFDGKGTLPYREDDPTNPISVYGASKLAGERAALAACSKTVIIRTAWLYDSHGKNFFLTMLRLFREKGAVSVVSDQQGNPTWAADLARAILSVAHILQAAPLENMYGVFHFSNEGITTWYDFAREIASQACASHILATNPTVIPVTSDAWPTPVKRPAWSALDKTKIKNTFGITVPRWELSLASCLKSLKE
ncbi:MAG TPA: dTDP-4-dehydrorhamnose reductase [Spirochaetota bacterium]|nr:dTDP-4-dehydrorhamnose reductase [Spirochaetota bacterium]